MCQLREPHNTDLQRYSILNELLSSNQCLYYKASERRLLLLLVCPTRKTVTGRDAEQRLLVAATRLVQCMAELSLLAGLFWC